MLNILKISLAGIVIVLATATAQSAHAAVWETKYQWTRSWEVRYQKWVRENWSKDYFTKDTPYKGLLFDCADAVYALRLIYAAEAGLPFVINDPTGGGGTISNEAKRWDHLPEDQRKRNFLKYLFGVVSTRSLPKDSYPVAVSPLAITPGTFIRTDEANHHSWTVHRISETGIPHLIYGTRPPITVLHARYGYPSTGFLFPNGLRAETQAGFFAFRWPEHLKSAVWDVPGYSLAQYDIPIRKWAATLQKKLQKRNETLDEETERLLRAVCDASVDRITLVQNGLNYLAQTGYQCMDKKAFDDFSTPSSDRRLRDSIGELQTHFEKLNENGSLGQISSESSDKLKQFVIGKTGNACPLKISNRITLRPYDLITNFAKGWVSWNPHDELKVRWGIRKGPGELAAQCPVY